ncbi:MAG TPA: hypothetical protein VGA06_02590 [Candidatus Paceibacterota bacterium]
MCKASIVASKSITAEEGRAYGIGRSTFGLGALHPFDENVESCVVCVRDGAKLIVENIPKDIQKEYGIGETEAAVFVERPDDNHDLLRFQNGATVVLAQFADQNVTVFIDTPLRRRRTSGTIGETIAA